MIAHVNFNTRGYYARALAQVVLRTAGLQAEIKKEKPLSKEEIIFEFVSEMAQYVLEKKGISEPKQFAVGLLRNKRYDFFPPEQFRLNQHLVMSYAFKQP